MKTTAWIYSIGLIIVAVVFSHGAADARNDSAREIRDLRGFDAIEARGGIDVHIRQGNEFLVEVFAPEGELDNVITEINGSTLAIRRSRGGGRFFGLFPVGGAIDVTLPELTAVSASGGSDIVGLASISGESLKISASGGADVTLEIEFASVEVTSSGGADITLTGSGEFAAIKTSGGSDLNAGSFSAHEAQLQTNGGSEVRLTVTGRLFGNVSGGSNVFYLGSPETVDVNVGGGGNLSGR